MLFFSPMDAEYRSSIRGWHCSAVGLFLALLAACTLPSKPPQPAEKPSHRGGNLQPQPPEELQHLHFMLGNWNTISTLEPGAFGKGGPGNRGSARIRLGPGDMYLLEEVSSAGPMGNTDGLAIYTYDPAKVAFVTYWFSSYRPIAETLTGHLEEDKLVFLGPGIGPDGGALALRLSIEKTGSESFRTRYEMGPDQNTLKLLWTMDYTR